MKNGLNPLRVALLYGAVGFLWILTSDWLVAQWGYFQSLPQRGQTAKGLFFIATTAVLLYVLISLIERRLKHERAWYRELFEGNPHPMWVYDLDTLKFLEVNNAAVQHYGYSRADFLSMVLADIRPPEDVPALRANVASVTVGLDRAGVWRHVRKDGSVIRVEISSHTVSFEGRRAEMVLAQDVTARLLAEEKIRESEARLHESESRFLEMAENVGDIYYNYDPVNDRLLYASPSFTRIWGRPVEMAHASPMFYVEGVHPEDRAIVLEADRQQREGRPTESEFRVVRPDGSVVWVQDRSRSLINGDGVVTRIVGTMRDVTAQKSAERSLMRSEQRFYELVDTMPHMVWVADPSGRVEFANRATTDYSGIPSDENLSEHWASVVHPDDLPASGAAWLEAVRAGTSYQAEARVRRATDGAYRWHHFRGTPVRDEHGTIVKWYGMGTEIHEIKLAEERANKLARRLSLTLESITDAFLTMDRDWRFTYVNGEAERMLYRRREDLLGSDMWTEFPAVKGSRFETEYLRARETGETVAFEAYYPLPLDKWFAVRAYPSAQGLAVYFRDVTRSRKEAELQHENEQRLKLITRATNDLIWDFDAVNKSIWWGEGFEDFFGPAPEGRTTPESFWEDRVHPEDRDRAISGIEAAFQGDGEGWSDEYKMRRGDGSYGHVLDRGFVLRDAGGRAVRMIGGITDLSERKRTEEDLRRLAGELERERAKLIVAQTVAKLGSWETDLRTSEVSMSQENFRIYGLDPATYKPSLETAFTLIHPEDRSRVEKEFKDSVDRPGSHTSVYKILLPDGSLKRVETNWRFERDADGHPLRAIGTTQDITARVALEEQFRQSQKMEAVGRLAGGVAHDFNNMLTVILVRAEQAIKRLAAGDPLRGSLREIYDAAERSAGLTRQLLTYARRQAVEPRVINLNETVGAMQKMLRRLIGEDVRLDWLPGADLWSARIDPVQVDQVLANLCVNARDAIRDVGRVMIETHNVVLDAEYCRGRPGCRPGEYVMIAVSDNGVGMDAETRVHLFEPFFTTKEVGKGTGLGLATVYGIVQQNNGLIHVYSEPGTGTAFKIYLPRVGAEGGTRAPGRIPDVPRGSGETVLVVEDERMILDVTVEILQGLEYKILATTSPEEAVVFAETHEGDIHLLLTDVIMPGMNGRDLAEKVRSLRPRIRILFMSGYTANVIQQRGLVEKGDAFVQKPFSTDDLAMRVRALLDASA